MKYQVGNRVQIKSLDWYNENKDECGTITFNTKSGDYNFTKEDTCFCGRVVTIAYKDKGHYLIAEDDRGYFWVDEMIEGLVESIEDRMKELRKMCTISLNDSNYSDKVEVLLNDYEYVEEGGKSYFVKKKKEYPKTHEECYQITGLSKTSDIYGYKNGLLFEFQKLLIALDAYWKIAGEEMGLGKPWELSIGSPVYYIYYNRTLNHIKKDYADDIHGNIILAFPTEKMRDAFYENFKSEIEICKELL